MQPDLPALAAVFGEVAMVDATGDGVRFDSERIAVDMIRKDDRYGGIPHTSMRISMRWLDRPAKR